MQRSNDPEAFTAFERSGWNTVISGYEQVFGPLTAQSASATLDALHLNKENRVLDICTGHGVLAAAAVARGAVVSGLDFAEEAVAIARRNVPTADIRQGDAQALPYPDASFDAVMCGYGLVHVPAPDRVLAEMYRVVRRGGRIAASVWALAAPDNGLGVVYGAIKAHGRLDVALPHGPDFFQLGDPANLRAALTEAGFTDIAVTPLSLTWRFHASSELLGALLQGAVRVRALLLAQEETVLARIRAATEQSVERLFRDGDGYAVPMPAIVGAGSRP